MLAVVEHQQKPAIDQVFQERLARRSLRIQDPKVEATASSTALRPQWAPGQPTRHRRENPTQLLRDSESQSGLSAPADTRERHQSVGLELPGEVSPVRQPGQQSSSGSREGCSRVRAALDVRGGRASIADGLDRGGGCTGVCIAFAAFFASDRLMMPCSDRGR